MIRPIVCTAQPPKKAVIRHKLKESIRHAQLLCANFEDTPQCRVAWDTVNDLTRALHGVEKKDVVNAPIKEEEV
jgi:hypothetical protein